MKYFLAVVREHEDSADGREHAVAALVAAETEEEAGRIHREAARHWYSQDEEPETGTRFGRPSWEFFTDTVHPVRCELLECVEIPEADYLVVRKYTVLAWDLTTPESPSWARATWPKGRPRPLTRPPQGSKHRKETFRDSGEHRASLALPASPSTVVTTPARKVT